MCETSSITIGEMLQYRAGALSTLPRRGHGSLPKVPFKVPL